MTSASGLRVGIVGCGLIGRKRAAALRDGDEVVGAADIAPEAAASLTAEFGGRAFSDAAELLALEPDVVVVAVSHDRLAELGLATLQAGSHLLIEKPAGISVAQIDTLIAAAQDTRRRVKVGFNHRFHPGIRRLAQEVHSGEHGELMHIRAHYGHGGRIGYDREWRADPRRSGGGELIDQGMHLLDITNWLAGPLPLHSALLRTHFWDTPVDDNAALVLGERDDRTAPWAMLHVSWTEWKNSFSVDVYCRTAKLELTGLVRSYGLQRLKIHRMRPDLGPPDLEELAFPDEDQSWTGEWEHLAAAIEDGSPLLGDLGDARYAWATVEQAYATGPYAEMRLEAT